MGNFPFPKGDDNSLWDSFIWGMTKMSRLYFVTCKYVFQ